MIAYILVLVLVLVPISVVRVQVAGSRDIPQAGAARRHLLQANNATEAPNQNTTAPPTPPPPSPSDPPSPNTTQATEDDWSLGQAALRLNLAGRQRMYSQKMAKDALLIHLGVGVETALWQMEETRQKFAEVSAALVEGSDLLMLQPMSTPELLAQLDVIRNLWDPFSQILEHTMEVGAITLNETLVISRLEEPLLAENHELVGMIERVTSEKTVSSAQDDEAALHLSAINQAGAQRMRSQKILVKYAKCVAKIDYDENLAALQATVDQFQKVHDGLLSGSEELYLLAADDPDVIYWLGQVDILWNGRFGFRAAVDIEPSKYLLPRLVETNIPLLGRYNVIVGLMTESSSAPPSPLAPPPFPSFPPIATRSSGVGGMLLVALIAACVVGFVGLCTLIFHFGRRSAHRVHVEGKEELHNPFITKIKIHVDDDDSTEMGS